MKPASLSNAILSFFSRHGLYLHPTKDRCSTRPTSTLLYICCNFGQIFCTNVIQFFSVQNMGHYQLKKCSKYHLVSLLDEKQRSTFDIFVPFFTPLDALTNSAMCQKFYLNFSQSGEHCDITFHKLFCNLRYVLGLNKNYWSRQLRCVCSVCNCAICELSELSK